MKQQGMPFHCLGMPIRCPSRASSHTTCTRLTNTHQSQQCGHPPANPTSLHQSSRASPKTLAAQAKEAQGTARQARHRSALAQHAEQPRAAPRPQAAQPSRRSRPRPLTRAPAHACTCAAACRGGGARNAGTPVAPRPATRTFTSYVPARARHVRQRLPAGGGWRREPTTPRVQRRGCSELRSPSRMRSVPDQRPACKGADDLGAARKDIATTGTRLGGGRARAHCGKRCQAAGPAAPLPPRQPSCSQAGEQPRRRMRPHGRSSEGRRRGGGDKRAASAARKAARPRLAGK